jgi:hypothetical protein
MSDLFTVGTTAILVRADSQNQYKISNGNGSTLYYKNASDVTSSSNDGNLTAGQSVVISAVTWIISAGATNVIVTETPEVDSLAVGAAGITPISAPHGFANWQPAAANSGTDTTPADGTQFVTSLFIPVDKTLTGAAYLIGSVGGTNKVYAVLYNSAGTNVANSSLTGGGATVGTTATVQTLAFTSAYAAKGPGLFYVGISINGTTARLQTVPVGTQSGILAGSVSQTQGTTPTVAAITAPTTFTADKAPVAFVY